MKKRLNFLIVTGALLVFAGVAAIAVTNFSAAKKLDAAVNTAEKIQQMLPPVSAGMEDMYATADMAALSVDGADYIALLEAEKYGVLLPVKNTWDAKTLSGCPQRFDGSCYSGNMIIGGSDSQLAFTAKVDVGDKITVTDMLGAEFVYTVQRIDRAKTAAREKLVREGYQLTIFARDPKTAAYIVVRCTSGV